MTKLLTYYTDYQIDEKLSCTKDKFIENDSLWKAQRILSLLDYCCSESFVDKISKNTIIVKYKFRTDKTLTNLYDKRFVTYKIDGITGSIKMIKIEK